jgi:hypothetical protein
LLILSQNQSEVLTKDAYSARTKAGLLLAEELLRCFDLSQYDYLQLPGQPGFSTREGVLTILLTSNLVCRQSSIDG